MRATSSGGSTGGPKQAGDRLPEIEKAVTQEQVNAYADAAGDWNPIHLDEEFAATTQFGTRIAHGMLGLGFVSEMMSTAFPDGWAAGGSLKVRFKAPIFPGETVKMDPNGGITGGAVHTFRNTTRSASGRDVVRIVQSIYVTLNAP